MPTNLPARAAAVAQEPRVSLWRFIVAAALIRAASGLVSLALRLVPMTGGPNG